MTYQTEPVTMWFDRRLAMRESPIHGIGTFATDAIPAGSRLFWVTGGIVYTSEDWRSGRVQLAGEQYNEGQIGADLFIATPKSLYYYITAKSKGIDPRPLECASRACARAAAWLPDSKGSTSLPIAIIIRATQIY